MKSPNLFVFFLSCNCSYFTIISRQIRAGIKSAGLNLRAKPRSNNNDPDMGVGSRIYWTLIWPVCPLLNALLKTCVTILLIFLVMISFLSNLKPYPFSIIFHLDGGGNLSLSHSHQQHSLLLGSQDD
eukprot:TRINITY_DN10218_c1_g1_i1.p1 TRINITY_DN10218_c1_g1~~TRINITY_DN10218_c1_g1_i1.p1  ORF type:complete len:127 (+),score=2.01 TRINITY_DN10218_c1_g1_i1:162-542(+)